MKYIQNPTLEHIARVKIVATLWNQDDVKNLLAKFCTPLCYEEFKLTKFYTALSYEVFKSRWVKIEAIALKKVAKLPLPKQVKEEILCIIRPVGLQIEEWKEFHNRFYGVRVDLPSEFCWTPQGTIDRRKTAEVMIKDESIDITTRYKLSCIYCLEEDVPKLWEEIPENCRESFYSHKDETHAMQKEMVLLWTYQINGEVDKMHSLIENRMGRRCSPYQYAFQLAASNDNKVATEYFLQKLTTAEREESLMNTAIAVATKSFIPLCGDTGFQRGNYSDVLCFLLSQLDEEQQLEVFKSNPWGVLSCFLNWPWQNFFMETANRMWSFFPEKNYKFVFIYFTGNVKDGYNDFNYRKLFREFWEQSPHDYKRHVLSDGIICRIILELLQIRDIDNIKLVFQDATPADKMSIIYRAESETTCIKLVTDNQLSLLKYFIKECLPSKDEVIEFKEQIKNGGMWRVNEYEYILRKWKPTFMCVLDEIIFEFEKENE